MKTRNKNQFSSPKTKIDSFHYQRGLIISLFYVLTVTFSIMGQHALPDVSLFTPEGKEISVASLSNDGMPMIITFYKSSGKDDCEMLYQLNDVYENVLQNQGVKLIAVCIDACGTIQHINPFIKGHALDIKVYADKNGDFKRAMCIPDAPFTLLLDREMHIFYQHSGASTNIQEVVCQKVNECLTPLVVNNN